MTDEPLYFVTVETRMMSGRHQLLTITGKRDTVIEAALRVILDSAPSWDKGEPPAFEVRAQVIR